MAHITSHVFILNKLLRTERPTYEVIKRLPAAGGRPKQIIEIRKYNPYLIAETTIDNESSMRKAGGQGFGKCASYIFGQNESKFTNNNNDEDMGETMAMTSPVRSVGEVANNEKMAMTAPVRSVGTTSSSNTIKTKISFVIGSKYNLKTVPKPKDKSVKIVSVPQHTLASTTFAGPPPSDERIAKERDMILATLEREGIQIKNKKNRETTTLVYGYHDPIITPNFLRRNEVAIVVDGNL